MVKAKCHHSLQRQPVEKLRQGTFCPKETAEKPFGSGEESREELNLSFQSDKNTIGSHHNPTIPSWDARAAPPAFSEADIHLNSEKIPYTNQNNHRNSYPVETNSQWDKYSAQSGVNRQQHNAKSKNIWSSGNQSFQDSDSSLYSASTNPSIHAFSLDALNASSQRNHAGLQHSYNKNIRGISESLNRSHLNGMKDDNNTVAASISSTTTYSNNTVPGLVGASSGSTGGTGGSSFTGQKYRSNYAPSQQHSQSMMNSGAQAFYPNQYPKQQDRAPPGFRAHRQYETAISSSPEERNFMYPNDGTSASDSISHTSGHYQNSIRRESTRKQSSKRQEWQNRDRKHVKDDGVSKRERGIVHRKNRSKQIYRREETEREVAYAAGEDIPNANSVAVQIMNRQEKDLQSSGVSLSSSNTNALAANRLPLDRFTGESTAGGGSTLSKTSGRAILPAMNDIEVDSLHDKDDNNYDSDDDNDEGSYFVGTESALDDTTTNSKKKDWLLRMNRRLAEVPIGNLDPSTTPISAIMNSWAKTKSSHGASMVEKWLDRVQEEFDAGNTKVVPTNKMFTMAVDAWAKSGEGVSAAQRAETILQHMNKKYQTTGLEHLKPTTGIFNAVINAWARSREKIAPSRAEQILKWMDNLHKTNPSIKPDKYTFNTGEYCGVFLRHCFCRLHMLFLTFPCSLTTVIHAYAKSGGVGAAKKAQELLNRMHVMYQQGNDLAKPDTITVSNISNHMTRLLGATHCSYLN